MRCSRGVCAGAAFAFIWQRRPKPAGGGLNLRKGIRYHGDPDITRKRDLFGKLPRAMASERDTQAAPPPAGGCGCGSSPLEEREAG